ncbi:PAS-rich protein [Penicillium brevicompactum tetramycovirus 1]|uniref:PAS-rich protein n=1 Tax=Penicillium brevicompactum tetramycovirus 1 TaxID=2485923 RepID=A0A3G3C4U3_9VIRU|nr:PAS-rich protein [Penicillium brevicompactum tetramycovirus 1]AYP71802.1 PAS-rich protein [Penicillium brevicompactum tetramycovirus 1]
MSSHVGKIASFLSTADLSRVRTLNNEDVQLVVRCLAAGVPPKAFAETLGSYDPNKEYDVLPSAGPVPTRKILAYSFLRDRRQYADTYAQSDEWAGRLRGLLDTDPKKAVDEISTVVNRRLRVKGSPAVADVEVGQVRGSTGSEATGGASDPNYAPLQQAMLKYSAQAGAFKFDAADCGTPRDRRFVVTLGARLIVGAQKKSTAIMAARLCRVLGRHDRVVSPYVGHVDEEEDHEWDEEIPADVADGKPVRTADRAKSPTTTRSATPTSPKGGAAGAAGGK